LPKEIYRLQGSTKGILLIGYHEKGRTITSKYYSHLDHDKIREKRPGLKMKKIIFPQKNEPAHKDPLVMGKLRDLGYDLRGHLPYSSDLAPSDIYVPILFLRFFFEKALRVQ
jgi:histone-lysine N-methyltransferase SETMAR